MTAPGSALPVIAIFGPPRSGTSWLGQIFNSSEHTAYRFQPLFSYEFKDALAETSGPMEIAAFHERLMAAESDFVLTSMRPAKTEVTHLVWKEVRHHRVMSALLEHADVDVIYLVRDPVDVLNSWLQAPKEFREDWDIHTEWRTAPSKNVAPSEYNGFDKWKESMALALELQGRHPDRMHLVGYEALRRDPEGITRRLFDACGLAYSPAVERFLSASTQEHDPDAYSVMKTENAPMRLPRDIVDAVRADPMYRALAPDWFAKDATS